MSDQPTIALNDGRAIPQLGLGVWRTPPAETAAVVASAVAAGYRHVDTAMIYGNEAGVGDGLRASGLAGEVFLTTKLWNDDQGYDETLKAFEASARRLGLETVDLYLIHWPMPATNRYVQTWKALVRLREEGRVRSIGVSNFGRAHLERTIGETGVTPAVNQIELHPGFPQAELRALHAELGVATESWSPLGQGRILSDPAVRRLADKHGRTPAQVVIRWHLDLGLVVIPKSVNPGRIAENFDVFGFRLDEDDMAALATLADPAGRIGPDPAGFG